MARAILLILLACVLALVSASPAADRLSARGGKGLTNAQRLARGLPPKAPKRLHDPTRVQARELSPSALPVGAIIEIRGADNGEQLGFLAFEQAPNRRRGPSENIPVTTDIRAQSPVVRVYNTGSGGSKIEIPISPDEMGPAFLYLESYSNDEYGFGYTAQSDGGFPVLATRQTTIFTYSGPGVGTSASPLKLSYATLQDLQGRRKRMPIASEGRQEQVDIPVDGIFYNPTERTIAFIPNAGGMPGFSTKIEFWLVPVEGPDRQVVVSPCRRSVMGEDGLMKRVPC